MKELSLFQFLTKLVTSIFPFQVNVTTCQRHRIRALGLAESPPLGTYVPSCNPDGSYNEVQCHAFTGICWCVNEKGHEILGTKNWGSSQCLRRGNIRVLLEKVVNNNRTKTKWFLLHNTHFR